MLAEKVFVWIGLPLLLCGFTVYASIVLNGTFVSLDGIEFVYQIPAVKKKEMKGVIFLAHGCTRHAGAFWPKNSHCEKCYSQPLSQIMVLEGLKRNFVMIAGSSHPQSRNLCWSNVDHPRVVKVLHYFYEEVLHASSQKIPLHILGVCNGGIHMGNLLQNDTAMKELQPITVTSIAAIISSIKLDTTIYTPRQKFPFPTYFVAMKKDGGIAWEIHKQLHLFQQVQVTFADPQPITKEYFFERGMGYFTKEDSELLADLFQKHGLLDKEHYLINDPISYNHIWREKDLIKMENSGLMQLLKSAFAYHGYTVQQYPKIFDFFEHQKKK